MWDSDLECGWFRRKRVSQLKHRRYILKCLGLLVPLGLVTVLWLCSFWRGSLITLMLPSVGGCGAMLTSGGLVLNWAGAHCEDGPFFHHRIVGVELLSEWPDYRPQMFLVEEMMSISWPLPMNTPPAWKLSETWGGDAGYVRIGSQQEWSYHGFTYRTERAYWSNLVENIYCRDMLLPRWAVTLAFFGFWIVALMLVRRWRGQYRRIRLGLCLSCGYDLRASGERCPECGALVPTKVLA